MLQGGQGYAPHAHARHQLRQRHRGRGVFTGRVATGIRDGRGSGVVCGFRGPRPRWRRRRNLRFLRPRQGGRRAGCLHRPQHRHPAHHRRVTHLSQAVPPVLHAAGAHARGVPGEGRRASARHVHVPDGYPGVWVEARGRGGRGGVVVSRGRHRVFPAPLVSGRAARPRRAQRAGSEPRRRVRHPRASHAHGASSDDLRGREHGFGGRRGGRAAPADARGAYRVRRRRGGVAGDVGGRRGGAESRHGRAAGAHRRERVDGPGGPREQAAVQAERVHVLNRNAVVRATQLSQ